VEVPTQEEVDGFLPPLELPPDLLLDPSRARTFSALPESGDYYAFQRHVAEAIDLTRPLLELVADEFTRHFGRMKVDALEISGNRDGETALVAIGSVADTALELLDHDDDLRVVRVHQYRPFPGERIVDALAGAAYVTVVDRAAAFGSLGPLGLDVLSLDLPDARAAIDVVCGLGGAQVTPDTLRWALDRTRLRTETQPIYVPEGV
jgi:pyruvate ferredoxin oxidoreductase alpha subunit